MNAGSLSFFRVVAAALLILWMGAMWLGIELRRTRNPGAELEVYIRCLVEMVDRNQTADERLLQLQRSKATEARCDTR